MSLEDKRGEEKWGRGREVGAGKRSGWWEEKGREVGAGKRREEK